jgi:hypothetical protein
MAEEAPVLSPGEPPIDVLGFLGKDRANCVAVVGHQPGLGALLCVSFEGAPRAGRGTLDWLAPPRMQRAIRPR